VKKKEEAKESERSFTVEAFVTFDGATS